MEKIRLGRTEMMVSRSGFGAIPIQRISFDEAKHLLQKAYDNGINFFDTARGYSDSEEKIGYALSAVRSNVIIASKSMAPDQKALREHLETCLKNLKTDYIDIFQIHNPKKLPDPNDPNSIYQVLLEAKKKGLIRFIGITNHRLDIALEAAASGLYDTVQFPLSSLSTQADLELIAECKKRDLGVIAMKALSGGLITNAASTFTFLRQYDNVVPIWGIEKETQLDEFIALEKNPPQLDAAMWQVIEKDRVELGGSFCRGCGYCMPCPVGIEINTAARMLFLLKRTRFEQYIDNKWKEKMELINQCLECGQCKSKCPYDLDTPNLLKKMLGEYREFCKTHSV